jgi:hypothetical protein
VWQLLILEVMVDFSFLQSVMKHAGKNNIKNINALTLGDEKPKIDTGQKINSSHHIGSNPAQVRQQKPFSFYLDRNEPRTEPLTRQKWTLNRKVA